MNRMPKTPQTFKPMRWTTVALLASVPLLGALPTPSSHAADPVSKAVSNDDIQALETMAVTGRFDDLLTRLATQPYPGGEAQSLKHDLTRYSTNQITREENRKEAFEESLTQITETLEEGKIEEALVSAIDAHSQNLDDGFFDRSDIQELSTIARTTADQASDAGDWMQAASLYRLLNLLYEVDSRFSDEQKRASEHLRVLQMYAPVRFQELADIRLAELRRGQEEDDDAKQPPKIDPEKWEDRLTKINRSVLERTMSDCVQAHINAPTYRQLLLGGIEQLQVLLHTPEAKESFPKFADTQARQRFIERLDTLRNELDRPGTKLTLQQVKNRISLIEATNEVTVKLPDEVLFYELTEGATDTIDTFTYVVWPADHQDFLDRTLHGKIYGVGIQIALEDYKLTVVSPVGNTPAHRAGLKAGDIIETVNGYATSAWSLKRAVKEITGEEGTPVTLGIRRKDEAELIEKRLIRAKIPIESVRGWDHDTNGKWDFWVDRESGIGYVRMTQFVEETAADLDKAIAELQKEGRVNGLVLDLRFNPGGLLQSAVQIVDRFVPKGAIVGQVDAEGRHIKGSLFNAQKDNTLPDFPLTVLVNQGSASASEIVSGALQDWGRATIIGERSYGKGSVQQVGWYPNRFTPKWGVRITTSHYTLPTGRVIHREENSKQWGVEPELAIEMTERQIAKAVEYRREVDVLRDPDEEVVPADALLDNGLDPQLEAALLVLKAKILANHLELARAGGAETATP